MNRSCACRSVSRSLVFAALCGLVSLPPAHAQEELRRATPPPGKALLFVFRVDPKPVAAPVPVIVNTVRVGELANGTFLSATIGPGSNYLQIGEGAPSTLVAAPNQSYFVRVKASAAQNRLRTEMSLVSESEGRQWLAQSRLAGAAPPASAPRPQTPPPAVTTAAPPKPSPAPVTPAAPPKPPPPPAATQPAPAPERAPATASARDWDLALIAHAGTFELANGNQVIAGLASTYDTTSKSVFGVEAEWRPKSGMALGGEVFSYKNDLLTSGAIPNAQQEVLAIMVNAKYYFRLASAVYPFVGAGVGQANASYSGGLTGSASGLAFQGLAGMELRFNRIGVNVQYRYLDSTIGDSGEKVKVGGSGILAGVSFIF